MSFTMIEQATPRLQRSALAVPGSNGALFGRAAKCAADVVFLDCEDAVAPEDKDKARKNIIAALNEIDWGAKTMMVRINGLDTHYMYRDVVDIVQACARLDMILIPKVGTAADVYAIDMLVTQIEAANEVFTPAEAEVVKAQRIVEAMAQAAREGKGAVSLDGRLIDLASIRMAEALLAKARAIEGKE